MRKYLALTKGDFMSSAVYRVHFIFIFVTNIFYIILLYFLWTAIYGDTGKVINGMTFNRVFVYLALASSIFCLFQTYMEWEMSRNVLNGNIVIDLIRPLDIQFKTMFTDLGFTINISFLMGLISFYTQSIWGFFFAKETLVLLLSGAVIPLKFYPRTIRTIVEMLPFQAIYNIPLTMLISTGLTGYEYLRLLAY